MQKKIALIGCASDLGGTVRGSRKGPSALHSLSIVPKLRDLSYSVVDYGEITSSPTLSTAVNFSEAENRIKNIAEVFDCCKQLSQKTESAFQKNEFPLILGGDHSLSIGSITGISNALHKKKQRVGLIWVDTHPDVNTPKSSPSRAAFGMSTAFLLGRIPGALASLAHNCPAIAEENMVYIALRDIDPEEKNYLKRSKTRVFTIRDIDIKGLQAVCDEAIAIATRNTAGFSVSFDLDACDPRLVPGTGTPYRGGLTFREAHLLAENFYLSQKMLSFEMVELNPSLDHDFQTARLALSLIESALGDSIL